MAPFGSHGGGQRLRAMTGSLLPGGHLPLIIWVGG
jgi:hypothetical protein